jgi:carbon-monoxide dehydrogenase medium subunit
VSVPPVTVLRPRSLEELRGLLRAHGDDARVYAGATELVVALKLGLTDAPLLVDLKHVAELADVMVDDDRVRIGATATHHYLARDPDVRAALPALAQVERGVANGRVRAIGTLGGNLCFGEPHSDPATFLVAAEAHYVLSAADGTERTVPAAELLLGPFEPCLGGGEIMTEAVVPRRPRRVLAYQRFVLTERPAAAVAVRLDVGDGVVDAASVVVGAATPVPAAVPVAAALLGGTALDPGPDLLASVGAGVADSVDLELGTDPDYLRQLVRTLTVRALEDAFGEARRLPPAPAARTSWRDLLRGRRTA